MMFRILKKTVNSFLNNSDGINLIDTKLSKSILVFVYQLGITLYYKYYLSQAIFNLPINHTMPL